MRGLGWAGMVGGLDGRGMYGWMGLGSGWGVRG